MLPEPSALDLVLLLICGLGAGLAELAAIVALADGPSEELQAELSRWLDEGKEP